MKKNVLTLHLTIMSILIALVILEVIVVGENYAKSYDTTKKLILKGICQEINTELDSGENNFTNYFISSNKYGNFLKIFGKDSAIYDGKSYLGSEKTIDLIKYAIKEDNFIKDSKGPDIRSIFLFKKNIYIVYSYKIDNKFYFLVKNINDIIDDANYSYKNIEFFATNRPIHKDASLIRQKDFSSVYIDYRLKSKFNALSIFYTISIFLVTIFIISIILTLKNQKDRAKFKNILNYSSLEELTNKSTKIKGFLGEVYSLIKKLSLELKEKNKKLEESNKLANRKREIVEKLFNADPEKYFKLSYSKFFDELLGFILNIFPHGEKGSVIIPDKNGLYKFIAMKGYDMNLYKNIRLRKDQLFINFESTEKPTIIKSPSNTMDENDPVQSTMNTYGNLWDLKETLSAPIKVGGKIQAIIYVDLFSKNTRFDKEDIELMDYFVAYTGAFLRNKLYYDKIIELSNIDELTKVYNRRYFEKIMYNEIKRTKRYNYKDGLLYFDLNDFKKINDQFGHKIGDIALIEFTKYIKTQLRSSDILSRFGGDEFIALLPFIQRNELIKKIESLKKKGIHIQHEKEKIEITYAMGYSIIPDDGETMDEVIIKADMNMYENKLKSKNAEK